MLNWLIFTVADIILVIQIISKPLNSISALDLMNDSMQLGLRGGNIPMQPAQGVAEIIIIFL